MVFSEQFDNEYKKVLKANPHLCKLQNCSILITGATGLICSTIIDLLLYCNKAHSLHISLYLAGRNKEKLCKRFEAYSEGTDFFFIQYDSSKEFVTDLCFDYIIHGASNSHPESISKEPVETILSNVVGLYSLLRIAAKSSTTRLLYISSSEVYGTKKDNAAYSEEDYGYVDILNPRSSYPSSKRCAETLCSSFATEYGVDFVIVRPGHVYGPQQQESDSRASAQFIRNAVYDKCIVLKSYGTQLRSYLFSLDCASAILTVLLKGTCGEAYNLSNKDSIVTIKAFAETLSKQVGTNIVFDIKREEEKEKNNAMTNSALSSKKIESLHWKGLYSLLEGISVTIRELK